MSLCACYRAVVRAASPITCLPSDPPSAGLPSRSPRTRAKAGADVQDRTGDLVLTKDALCQLSYIGLRAPRCGRQVGLRVRRSIQRPATRTRRSSRWLANRSSRSERRLERETGIEPATNSLEGCDSTTELLPPIPRASFPNPTSKPQFPISTPQSMSTFALRASADNLRLVTGSLTSGGFANRSPLDATRAKVGGEGRTRTFEATRATDLQSAAFDRFATSPAVCVGMRASWSYVLVLPARPRDSGFDPESLVAVELAKGFEPPTG
jgi:hypothetical protein